MADTKYTINDVGCYVDGSRGIYATDRIVEIANEHGAVIVHDTNCDGHTDTCFESTYAGCEFGNEYENEATDYMNEHFAVDGAYWGRNENGDWGLWLSENSL